MGLLFVSYILQCVLHNTHTHKKTSYKETFARILRCEIDNMEANILRMCANHFFRTKRTKACFGLSGSIAILDKHTFSILFFFLGSSHCFCFVHNITCICTSIRWSRYKVKWSGRTSRKPYDTRRKTLYSTHTHTHTHWISIILTHLSENTPSPYIHTYISYISCDINLNFNGSDKLSKIFFKFIFNIKFHNYKIEF